jgi:hypothetical protein
MRDAWQNIVRSFRHSELRANDLVKNHGMLGRQFLILIKSPPRYIVQVRRVIRMQVFVDGDRIYKLMYVGPVLTQEEADVETFFASFQVNR